MKNFKKNMFGFTHHAILGMVVVGVIAIAGVRVLGGIHAQTPSLNQSSTSSSPCSPKKYSPGCVMGTISTNLTKFNLPNGTWSKKTHPFANVNVKLTYDNKQRLARTDAEGFFFFKNVPAKTKIKINPTFQENCVEVYSPDSPIVSTTGIGDMILAWFWIT